MRGIVVKSISILKNYFPSFTNYTHGSTDVLIILSDVCDIPKITSIASSNNFLLEKIAQRSVWARWKKLPLLDQGEAVSPTYNEQTQRSQIGFFSMSNFFLNEIAAGELTI